jgi:hypothetical protein
MKTRLALLVVLTACTGDIGGILPPPNGGGDGASGGGNGGGAQGSGGGVSGTGGGTQASGGGSTQGTGGGSSITSPDLPCEVATVLQTTCQQCHGSTLLNGAPIHLITRADLLAASAIDTTKSVGERCVFRMRTPAPGGMPPPPNAPIAMADIDAFDAWVTSGMPLSSCGLGAGGGAGGGSAGTGGGSAGGGSATGGGTAAFTPDSPAVYLTKVKNVLVGLPPTDTELQTITADPSQLGALVDQWMQLPQYQTKMLRFFELAFQQTQVTLPDFAAFTFPQGPAPSSTTAPLMLQNLEESFARTMIHFANNNTPFTQAMTTNQLMMTTALKSYYAFKDASPAPNAVGCGVGSAGDDFKAANPTLKIYATAQPIPLSETLDAGSPNYMHWTDPDVATDSCGVDPVLVPTTGKYLYQLIFGQLRGATNGMCPGYTTTGSPVTTADFQDWRLTTITQAPSKAARTPFYDLATLRSTNTLALTLPQMGFLTPAFFANWPTNASNQMRVVMNQAFIVATGAQVDGNDPTAPTTTPGLDPNHAQAGTACYVCHRTLDPSRSILSATYSWNLGPQTDGTLTSQPGLFAFQGVISPVTSVADLGTQLSKHPLVAPGWAQKLCYYVNSEACVETDPDFQTIVQAFQAGYSWNKLVKAVVTSPITTHVRATATVSANGEIVAVARRDHLCAAWNARLGLADACGLDASQTRVLPSSALSVVSGLPSDGYARGSIAPVLPTDPTLFFRGGIENLCEALAVLLVDNNSAPAGAHKFSSATPTTTIPDLVATVIGIPPSDARSAQSVQILTNHFNAAKATAGITATQAMQSTFTAACASPPAISVGL